MTRRMCGRDAYTTIRTRVVYREGGIDILSAPMKYRNQVTIGFSLSATSAGYRQ